MWSTSSSTKDDVYILSVHPPPVYGSNATETLHSSMTTLSLNNSIQYDINITLCSYEAIASQFSIGKLYILHVLQVISTVVELFSAIKHNKINHG